MHNATHALGRKALIGTIIGSITAGILFNGVVLIAMQRRKRRRIVASMAKPSLEANDTQATPEQLNDNMIFEFNDNRLLELSPVDVKPELIGSEMKHELEVREGLIELPAKRDRQAPLNSASQMRG